MVEIVYYRQREQIFLLKTNDDLRGDSVSAAVETGAAAGCCYNTSRHLRAYEYLYLFSFLVAFFFLIVSCFTIISEGCSAKGCSVSWKEYFLKTTTKMNEIKARRSIIKARPVITGPSNCLYFDSFRRCFVITSVGNGRRISFIISKTSIYHVKYQLL